MELLKDETVWSDSGAGKALTTSHVVAPESWQDAFDEQTELFLSVDHDSGTAPTSVELLVQLGSNAATPVSQGYVPAVDRVLSGVSTESPLQPSLAGAWATYTEQCTIVQLPPNKQWRIWAKRTGGDATTKIVVTASVSKIG